MRDQNRETRHQQAAQVRIRMNPPALSVQSTDRPAIMRAPLQGRALRAVHILWWAGAVLALFSFAAAASVDYDRLQQVCNSPDCVFNPAMVAELQPLGLPLRYVVNYLIAIE